MMPQRRPSMGGATPRSGVRLGNQRGFTLIKLMMRTTDYAARRSLVVSAVRRRQRPLDTAIAMTTTKNPMTDSAPAMGALCVSRRR